MNNENQGRNRPATKSEKRVSMVFIALILFAIAALSGCTAIGHKEPPADWPKLAVTEQKLGFMELQTACGGTGGAMVLLVQYFGCAWIYFETMTCKIYYAADDESGDAVREHERDHCLGKDHIGTSTLSDGWAEWKAQAKK